MNELKQSIAGAVCLVDNDPDRRALIETTAARLGLRQEFDENVKVFQPHLHFARPACLLVADHLLPKRSLAISSTESASGLFPFNGLNLATIVLASQPSVQNIVHYMRSGAVAVLTDPLDSETLAQWIAEALKEDTSRAEKYVRSQGLSKIFATLSPRKQVVLRHMIEGRASKWSANDLDVSRRTIELDRAEILNAFGAGNAIELARTVGPWLDTFQRHTPEELRLKNMAS